LKPDKGKRFAAAAQPNACSPHLTRAISYVALSRARSLAGLHVLDMVRAAASVIAKGNEKRA
jgi:ATP-dependent exoDNAse (exonuclease V) alpha subunit